MGTGTLGGGDFFRWDLKTPCIRSSKYETQTKKLILTVISTIFHFWPPTLTTFRQSVFVSLLSMVYTVLPLPRNIFLLGLQIFLYLLAMGRDNFKSWGPSILGRPNFLFGRRGLGHFLPQSHQ